MEEETINICSSSINALFFFLEWALGVLQSILKKMYISYVLISEISNIRSGKIENP